jgi:hypothetical protein
MGTEQITVHVDGGKYVVPFGRISEAHVIAADLASGLPFVGHAPTRLEIPLWQPPLDSATAQTYATFNIKNSLLHFNRKPYAVPDEYREIALMYLEGIGCLVGPDGTEIASPMVKWPITRINLQRFYQDPPKSIQQLIALCSIPFKYNTCYNCWVHDSGIELPTLTGPTGCATGPTGPTGCATGPTGCATGPTGCVAALPPPSWPAGCATGPTCVIHCPLAAQCMAHRLRMAHNIKITTTSRTPTAF